MNAALSERVPCHTCFGCLKGDLETLVYLHGELDCHAGALLAWRIPEKQLKAKTVVDPPTTMPGYTVCTDCAAKAKMQATASAVVAYCDDMRIRPIDGEA
jgi:hypothetical protein